MKSLLSIIRHISDMTTCGGSKRIVYAFLNILAMALGIAFTWCAIYCIGLIDGTSIILGIAGLLISGALAVFTVLYGFIGQFALIFIAGAGMFKADERGKNFVAFIIALVTSVGLVVAGYFVIKYAL